MTLKEFSATLVADTPPPGLTPALLALWYDGRGQ
jgi:hypothetical protein